MLSCAERIDLKYWSTLGRSLLYRKDDSGRRSFTLTSAMSVGGVDGRDDAIVNSNCNHS